MRQHLEQASHERSAPPAPNLPVQRTPLIGREQELLAAKQLLLALEIRLLTLTGASGSGKTRLAIQLAADVGRAISRRCLLREPGSDRGSVARGIRTEGGDYRVFQELAFENENIRAALEWLTATGNAEWGLRLGVALHAYWHRRTASAEGHRLLSLLRTPAAAARTRLRATALSYVGGLAIDHSDFVLAREVLEEGLTIARELGDPGAELTCLDNLAILSRELGNYTAARSVAQETVDLRVCSAARD